MRVALVTESSYPLVTGAASSWCDELLRSLPDHAFEVLALTPGAGDRPVLPRPGNVTALRLVPLRDRSPAGRTPDERTLRPALSAFRALLRAVLDEPALHRDGSREAPWTGPAVPGGAGTPAVGAAVRSLFRSAQAGLLSPALRSDAAVKVMTATWRHRFPASPLTLQDAVAACRLLEQALSPLAAPVVDVDVCHPVANGLPVLPALAAKWRHGTPYLLSEHGASRRECYLALQDVRYPWPVKAVSLAFLRSLCRLGYACADAVVPATEHDRRWALRQGADPARMPARAGRAGPGVGPAARVSGPAPEQVRELYAELVGGRSLQPGSVHRVAPVATGLTGAPGATGSSRGAGTSRSPAATGTPRGPAAGAVVLCDDLRDRDVEPGGWAPWSAVRRRPRTPTRTGVRTG